MFKHSIRSVLQTPVEIQLSKESWIYTPSTFPKRNRYNRLYLKGTESYLRTNEALILLYLTDKFDTYVNLTCLMNHIGYADTADSRRLMSYSFLNVKQFLLILDNYLLEFNHGDQVRLINKNDYVHH